MANRNKWLFKAVSIVMLFALTTPVLSGRICLEAEYPVSVTPEIMRPVTAPAETSHNQARELAEFAGEGYLAAPQGVGKPPDTTGRAEYSFLVTEPGRYYLWLRVWWVDGCGNSFGVKLDDNPEFTFGQDNTYKTWHWFEAPSGLQQLKLSQGWHSVEVHLREDGAYLDQILLIDSDRYVPMGQEEPSQECSDQNKYPVTGKSFLTPAPQK